MVFVQGLFAVALGLIVLSAVTVLGLTALRTLQSRSNVGGETLRRLARSAFLTALQGGPDLAPCFAPLLRHPPALAEALLEFSGMIRGESRERMLCVLLHEGAVRALERGALTSRRSQLVCVEAIGLFPQGVAEPVLCRLLYHKEAPVRFAAALALLDLGAALPFSLAGQIASARGEHAGLCNALLRRMIRLHPEIGRGALQGGELDAATTSLVIDALSFSGGYACLPDILLHADSSSPAVRATVALAVGRLNDPRGVSVLSAGLSDRSWLVRAAAAQAAGMGKFQGLASELNTLLADPIWSVRFQVVEALKGLGPVGLAYLRRQDVDSGDAEVCHLAGGALPLPVRG